MFAAGEAFECSTQGGVLVVRALRAKLRDLDAEELIGVLLGPSEGSRTVVVDLTMADFMSTAVLSALTRVATEHRLRLVGVCSEVDRLFGMLGVRSFFHTCESLESALADLGVGG